MRTYRVRHARLLALIFVGMAACSGGGLSCGSCISPITREDGAIVNYDGPKTNNAVDVKVSEAGFSYINDQWQTLLGAVTTNPIHVPVACTSADLPLVGTTYLCDQNLDKCSSASACDISVQITNFGLEPGNSSQAGQDGIVHGAATLIIKTGDVYMKTDDDSLGECAWLSGLEGHINFDSTHSAPNDYTLSVDVNFTLDGHVDPQHPVLTFDVNNISGLDQLDAADLQLHGDNNCGSIYFGLGDFLSQDLPALVNFIVQQLEPQITAQVQNMVESMKCRKCGGATDPICPTGANGGQDSTCQSGKCMVGDQCVPLLLGIEGLIQPGQLLGQYGVPADSSLAISAAAGGAVTSADSTSPGAGLTLGIIGGARSNTGAAPDYLAPCVPDLPAPVGTAPPVPNFDGEAPDGGYHVGLAISDYFLNQAAYAAHRSGAICVGISGQQVSLLSTGLFKTFLPSLGLLAGTSTQDAPMMVALRPLTAPTIDIGEGTYDPATKMPIDPLITLTMKNVDLDVYAFIEDRWSRLFTMNLDVQLPLSLIIDGCPQAVTLAIGDLHNLIVVNQAPSNAELLAEDPAVLQGLIPAVVALAQPALASALQPIAIPDVSGFSLHLDGLKGIGNRAGTSFDDLGLFGELRLAGQCDAASVRTRASLVSSKIPTPAELHPTAGEKLPWPEATVAVDATGATGDVEYDFRVDNGLWSTFRPGPQLTVSDPRFLLEGHHTIEVRGRPAHGRGISDPRPVKVDFLVDWEKPQVHVKPDAQGQFQVEALDNVSGPQSLQYRYAVGNEGFSGWGPARAIDGKAVIESGRLTVEVKDEAGNVGQSTWRGPQTVATAGLQPPP